ncbi:MAG: cell division protein FtsA [Rhodospirillaceae bacterium]|nr:cell division protein FtsA [Rhodospirillaceae bacterium]MYF87760.1 cell division protein FtsA [Rhodospirillaceae bacterium]MYH36944.1 cell division protein FtsA [Rhodospirillaceae bacterium]MYK12607.1 cell division protein FtsA [Rhodospirillaceae bacterium]
MAKRNGATAAARNQLVAALDIGTSKVTCIIAQLLPAGQLRVVGIGKRDMKGMARGSIVNMDAARDSIANTVHIAENMTGETVKSVIVSVSCGQPKSEIMSFEAPIANGEVGPADIRRLLQRGQRIENELDRALIHSIPVGFRLDGARGIRNPRGLFGETLGAEVHTVTAEAGPVRSLAACVRGCHLEIEHFVMAPYASGLATLIEDEWTLGATVIDMGAGVTGAAVFMDGEIVFADTVPVGGNQITRDLAHGLSTPIEQAEILKVRYGSAVGEASDDRAIIEVPAIGAEENAPTQPAPKSLLTGIIRPRVEETLELVRSRLQDTPYLSRAGRRIILSGGGCQLKGVPQLASTIFDGKVRIGRAIPFDGLAESAMGQAYTACTGLLRFAAEHRADTEGISSALGALAAAQTRDPGLLGRFGNWLREHF